MSEQTFTHKDIAGLLGVSETTVKSYRRKFPGCIPVSNQGKPIRFTPEAVAVATRIRDLFETGMNVEEVRTRLAAEFSWIQPAESPPAKNAGRGSPGGGEITPELSQGVSNMAKSMVAMTQQQKAILTRIQGLEALLEDLGLKDGATQADLSVLLDKRAEAARQRQALLENRLDKLDERAEQLAGNVQGLSEQLERFFGQRAKAAVAWREESATTMAEAAHAVEQAAPAVQTTPAAQAAPAVQTAPSAQGDAPPDGGIHVQPVAGAMTGEGEGAVSRVIPLRRASASPPGQGAARPSEASLQEQAARPPVSAPLQEPPRRFFSLPLVARTEQGQYISAGGKSRGPFSLNDLKAMLIYGFTPPHHFTLRWERHGQGWCLFLGQEKGERRLQLVLMELTTQRGGSVVEILQITDAENEVHPAEICGIIDSFSS